MNNSNNIYYFMKKNEIDHTVLEDVNSYHEASKKFLEQVSLTDIQKRSFDKFIKEIIPYYLTRKYSSNKCEVYFTNWYLDYSNTNTEEYCRRKKLTYEAKLIGDAVITVNKSNYNDKFTFTKKLEIDHIPLVTKNGGVIINGMDRLLVSHLEENNSIRLEDIVTAKDRAKTLKLKTSLRSQSTNSNATFAQQLRLEYDYNTIFMDIGNYRKLDPIKIITENYDSLILKDYQYIIGDSTEMLASLMSNLKYIDNDKTFIKNVKKEKRINDLDINNVLGSFVLKYDERDRLNRRLSLLQRATDKIAFEDVYDLDGNIICSKGEQITIEVSKYLESIGKDVLICSKNSNDFPIKIINNKFALADNVIKNKNLLDFIPTKIKGKKINITELERLISLSETNTAKSLEDLIDDNMDKLLGVNLNFDDLVSMINLFGQFLSNEIDPDDATSLETKSLVSISEIYEEILLKKFAPAIKPTSILAKIEKEITYQYTVLARMPILDITHNDIANAVKGDPSSKTISKSLTTHKLFNIDDTTSPFSQASLRSKISQQQVEGRGGVPSDSSNIKIRTINPSFMGRIDLQETTEGANVGLVRYLTIFSKLDLDGSIMAPFCIVDKKNRTIDYKNIFYLKYEDEKLLTRAIAPKICKKDQVVIEFYDANKDKVDIKYYPTKYIPTSKEPIDNVNYERIAKDILKDNEDYHSYKIIYQRKDWFEDEDKIMVFKGHGEIFEVPYNEVDIISLRSDHLLSASSASTPFVQHNDSARQMMGNNHSKQAIAVENPNEPYITTEVTTKIMDVLTGTVKAPISGIAETVEAKQIVIQPFDESKEKVYIPLIRDFETNIETHLFSRPTINVGDIVLEGDIIACNNMTSENGYITHGVNLVIAIMPYEGKNFEDSLVISDRLIKENILTSLHLTEVRIEIDLTEMVKSNSDNKKQVVKEIPYSETGGIDRISSLYAHMFDNEGLINQNTVVEPGQPIITTLTLDKSSFHYNGIVNYKCKYYTYDSHVPGTILYSTKEITEKKITYIVKIVSKEEINPGDKMSGRHGNKGVVSTILREEDMPFEQKTGQRVDLIFNPLGIPSRMNLGQLFEAQLTPILKAFGLRAELIPNEKIDIEMFKKLVSYHTDQSGKYTDKVQLCDGKTGEPYEGLSTLGISYFLKSKHQADHKIATRSFGSYNLYGQPPKGKKHEGGQKLGQMELWSLAEHGVNSVITELLSNKSDDIAGRNVFKKYLRDMKDEDGKITYDEDLIEVASESRNIPFTQKLINAILQSAFIYPQYLNEDGEEIHTYLNSIQIKNDTPIIIDTRLKSYKNRALNVLNLPEVQPTIKSDGFTKLEIKSNRDKENNNVSSMDIFAEMQKRQGKS